MLLHEHHPPPPRAMSGRPTATLCAPEVRHASWRWEVFAEDNGPTGLNIPLPGLRAEELLETVAEVDRVHACSEYGYAVAARNAVVERLLTGTWCQVVEPLSRHLGGVPSLVVRVPSQLIRLPIATARCSSSGESLVHLSDVTVQTVDRTVPRGYAVIEPESTAYRPRLSGPSRPHRWYSTARIHRLDGHQEDIQELLQEVAVGSSDTLLLMGCRTAELLPRLKERRINAAVVTLWDVEDQHCGPLGDALVAAMASGLSSGEALRSVQALRSDRPPFEWAGYAAVEPLALQPLFCATTEMVAR